MKTKLTTLLLLVFVFTSNAQFKANLQLKDFDINTNDVVAFKKIYVTYVKDFGNEFEDSYTFNSDGYLTSDKYYSKISYQNSYQKVTKTSRKENKEYTYFILKTPIATYLADTKQVKTNSKGVITDIFFKSNDGKYDSNLEFTYDDNLIMTKPDLDYLSTNIYTEKGLLIKEFNASMGNYYNAYDAKTNLQSIRVFNLYNDSSTDLYNVYFYEFDSFGNWIVKYDYESFPTYGNKLDNLKRIEVRQLTYKNGTKTGYASVNQDIKNKGLAKIKTLNVQKIDKSNFPIYYEQKEQILANTSMILNDSKCEGDCQNGWGKYTYNNGYYDGFWENGLKQGYGVYGWTNGDKYFGYWYKDKMSDFGQTQFINGNEYVGSYLEGKYHGNALFYEKDKNANQYNKYENGKFLATNSMAKTGLTKGCTHGDCTNGFGVMNYENGEVFVGEFKNGGLFKGFYYFTNGDTYQGMFNHLTNKFKGYGFYHYKASDDFYKGMWVEGKQNGRGLSYTNGKYYKDEWKDNKVVKSF